jgi:hypothetical protein
MTVIAIEEHWTTESAESFYGLTPFPSGPGDQTAQLREQS